MKLPQQLTLAQLMPKWASIINPFISNPVNNALILKNISLITGSNVVNHKLGRDLQGWSVIRYHNSYAQIYDTQDFNQIPNLTLNLNSSANVLVDLQVF